MRDDEEVSVEGRTFKKIDQAKEPLAYGEYENCSFISCELSNADLSSYKFIACRFEGCNISMAKLTDTVFQDIAFVKCKMLGLHFEQCNPFGLSFSFEDCMLDRSSFYKTKIKKTVIKHSSLREVDFTECDTSNSLIEDCDLERAVFQKTNIEKADLRSSFSYSSDPAANRLKKARFSLSGIGGLLEKYDIDIE